MLTYFSPEKVLYRYSEIKNYLDTGNIFTPTSIDIDLSGNCNNNCYFCNGKRVHNNKNLSLDKLKVIIEQALQLGINHCCIAGGGEPFCNPDFVQIDEYLNNQGFNKLLTTNGLKLLDIVYDIYNYDSIGVSFDCLTQDDYSKTRRTENFHKLWNGIEVLNKKKESHDIRDTTCKTLITKFNYNKLYKIAYYARELGFDNIYIRPAGLYNIQDKNLNPINLDEYKLANDEIRIAQEQLENANNLITPTFNVYYSNPFYDDITTPKYEFEKCLACMLNLTFCTDEYIYLCMEQRGNPKFRLCEHKDWLKYWNTDLHKNMIQSINIKDCPRCAKNNVNKIIQDGIINDNFNRYYI